MRWQRSRGGIRADIFRHHDRQRARGDAERHVCHGHDARRIFSTLDPGEVYELVPEEYVANTL